MTKNELAVNPIEALTPLINATEKTLAAVEASEGMMKSLAVAHGIIEMRNAVSDETKMVLRILAGDPSGFQTDEKDDGSGRRYTPDEIANVCLHALMKGARLVGDEFQIIKGRLYLGKEYFVRMLGEVSGVSDVRVEVCRPEACGRSGKETLYAVAGYAFCKVDGKPVEVELTNGTGGDTRVVVSAFDSIDAAAGKARKRLAQMLYERVTGSAVTEDEGPSEALPVGLLNQTPDWELEFAGRPEPVPTYAQQFGDAKNADELRDVWKSVQDDHKAQRISARDVDALRRYSTWRFENDLSANEKDADK